MSGEPKIYDLKDNLKKNTGQTAEKLRQKAANANSILALREVVQELIKSVYGKQK